jgi:hypothetical protein
MSEIPGQSGHALPGLQLPVCAISRHRIVSDLKAAKWRYADVVRPLVSRAGCQNRLDGFRRLSEGLQMSDEITWVVKDKIHRCTACHGGREGGRHCLDASRHSPHWLLGQAHDAAGLRKQLHDNFRSDPIRRGSPSRRSRSDQPAVAAVPLSVLPADHTVALRFLLWHAR